MGKAHATAFRECPPGVWNEPVSRSWNRRGRRCKSRGKVGWRVWLCPLDDKLAGDRRRPWVDVVDITTPITCMQKWRLPRAGKHVYCEKPLATTSADAARIVAAVEKSGVISIVGFNYLKNPRRRLHSRSLPQGSWARLPSSGVHSTRIFSPTPISRLAGGWIMHWQYGCVGRSGFAYDCLRSISGR